MKNREELIEQYEDALLALLMYDIAQAEGEEALKLNELLKNDPHAALPESLQRRCERTIRNAFAKQNIKRAGRTAGKVIQRVSVAAMLAMLLFTTAFAVSEDFRIATLNTVIQVFDDHTRITFRGTSSTNRYSYSDSSEGLDYQYNIALDWIPEGYEIESGGTTETGGSDHIAFISPKNGLIDINIRPYSSTLTYTFDTEGCTEETVVVQGHSATLYIKAEDIVRKTYINTPQIWGEMTVLWIDESNQIIVRITATNMSEDEILRLAEGVHWAG